MNEGPTIEANTDKISREEMVDMFGKEVPMEAVQLLWSAPGEMTIGQMRAELRRIAAAKPPTTGEGEAR